jgi:hypothetical protein
VSAPPKHESPAKKTPAWARSRRNDFPHIASRLKGVQFLPFLKVKKEILDLKEELHG